MTEVIPDLSPLEAKAVADMIDDFEFRKAIVSVKCRAYLTRGSELRFDCGAFTYYNIKVLALSAAKLLGRKSYNNRRKELSFTLEWEETQPLQTEIRPELSAIIDIMKLYLSPQASIEELCGCFEKGLDI